MALPLSRREFSTLLGGLALSHPLWAPLAEAAEHADTLFASAYMDAARRYGIAILNSHGRILARYPLPNRGHGFASGEAAPWLVAFARRPGNFALAIDRRRQSAPLLFKTPPHTHFYGHGAFSPDGRLLFASENEFDSGQGRIGIYDATGQFTRVGEMPSHGIGPHELIMMPDGHTLCVANGGILTHPDSGRAKLNLHDMRSSIAFVDSRHGELRHKLAVPARIHRLSLRHMAVDHSRTVWLGGQYEGESRDMAPLIATASLEQGLDFPEIAPEHTLSLAQYVGSVACSVDGRAIAFSSPRGHRLLMIDARTRAITTNERIQQVCGIAAHNGADHAADTTADPNTDTGFLATSLSGAIYRLQQDQTLKSKQLKGQSHTTDPQPALFWDNHLGRLFA